MQPIFILGNNRSGTSLYRLMLNGHSKIVVPPESHFFLWLADKHGDWVQGQGFERILDDIYASTKFETWEIDRSVLLSELEAHRPRNYAELIERVYLTYDRAKSPTYWGDKNSLWVEKFDRIRSTFPDLIVLHIVRNGLDVACSYRELSKRDLQVAYAPKLSSDIATIAALWDKNNQALSAFGAQLGPAQYHCIRFEDLLLDPKRTLTGVLDHLGLDFEEGMLDYHRTPLADFKEPQEFMAWKAKLRAAPDPSGINKYMEELDPQEIEKFRNIARASLQQFGYL